MPGIQTTITANYATRIAVDGLITYIGRAALGSSPAAKVWQIQRIDETSGTVITWAGGNDNFNEAWDNRATITYS